MDRNKTEFVCNAQTKLTIAQSGLLDEMARVNNTTRSYELRMILDLYGKERLHLDADRMELVEADKACMSLYELYKEIYPIKEVLYSILWYTGIHIVTVGLIGYLELEMLNRGSIELLFRYTNKFYPPIKKKYPELALKLEKIIEMTGKYVMSLDTFIGDKNDEKSISIKS